MPQNTQHTLIHVLLFWTTILSISQIVFIILLFTNGHHGPLQFQNKSTEALGGSMQLHASSPTLSGKLVWGMLTYTADGVTDQTVKWKATSTDSRFLSEEGHNLTIKRDGYFFLTLQVKMLKADNKDCAGKVRLKWNSKTLLDGSINKNTCSTELLGKVQALSAGGNLMVTINSTLQIDSLEYHTHLDLIYLCKL